MVGTSTEFSTVLELCQDRHRRIVLAALAGEERSLTVRDLEHTIVKYNHHAPPEAVSEDESTRIRISLHHVHLPKLADLSLVDYDRERGLVEPTSRFDRLQPQLSAIIDADPGLDAPLVL
ncbi:DUF7344 domain-containing protein [Halopiger xanaduensis]|uniref:DUF7344 domain-containing protein n=1 Tax=Halopiger xanaduensis (strain DSM 18323 / JCM 14033 / SH-6) TaxID=797210 RepID=F8D596_HALXS|nr:hypothetical protein [Halopiger xanaduensis]AEH37595.1 hypothetical protein Halxa_2979 [Halopiger xanaduensis SH-6]